MSPTLTELDWPALYLEVLFSAGWETNKVENVRRIHGLENGVQIQFTWSAAWPDQVKPSVTLVLVCTTSSRFQGNYAIGLHFAPHWFMRTSKLLRALHQVTVGWKLHQVTIGWKRLCFWSAPWLPRFCFFNSHVKTALFHTKMTKIT